MIRRPPARRCSQGADELAARELSQNNLLCTRPLTGSETHRILTRVNSIPLGERRAKSPRWARLAALVAILLGLALAALHWAGAKSLVEAGVGRLREAGPLVFFSAMALLPAAGFPLLPFTVAAGPVFGPTLGAGTVIGCAIAAVVVNVAISYWLASRALRPLVSRLVGWLGYPLPVSTAETAWQLVTIVRIAPGLPFWVQSYLLGLMGAPFAVYMVVSTLIPAAYLTAVILCGEALWDGRVGKVALGVGLLGLVGAVIHLLRKHQAARTGKAAIAGPTPPA